MQSHNSMDTTGKDACWKFVRIDSLGPQVAASEVVADLQVVCVEVSEVDLVAVGALAGGTVDEVAMEEEVAMVVLLQVASMMLLLLPALQQRILSLTMLHPEESLVNSSTFAM